jgi:hypothetical protein
MTQIYKHRYLTEVEQQKFKDLYDEVFKNDTFMSLIHRDLRWIIIYPAIIAFLLTGTIMIEQHFFFKICCFFCGLVSIQLHFVVSHMWAHSLMLEYSLWTIDEMIKKVGMISTVTFHAFYHHHNSQIHNWWNALPSDNIIKEGKYVQKSGPFSVAIAHWVSFSLFTMNYPTKPLVAFYVMSIIYIFPITFPFFLGYEFGVLLLPISHDWVHQRIAARGPLYYFLLFLEKIGIIATKEDHATHHTYNHPTVYQGFTSSGIYSKFFDNIFDGIWDKAFYYSQTNNIPLYKVLKPFALTTLFVVGHIFLVLIIMFFSPKQ